MENKYESFGFVYPDVDIYFNWLCNMIKGSYYEELLFKLFTTEFISPDGRDSSRIFDGLKLRDKFEWEVNHAYKCGRKDGCSVLEMLIGLAIRLDDDVMYEIRYGDRFVDWFWLFIDNMGMSQATDSNWNFSWSKFVDKRIRDIMAHNYKENGEGGMFVIENRDEDMREVDIWRQLMWFISENIKNGVID